MKPREAFLITFLIVACRGPEVGQRYRHPTEPAVTYTVLGISNGVLYAVRHEAWPVDKYETGRVSRALFIKSLTK